MNHKFRLILMNFNKTTQRIVYEDDQKMPLKIFKTLIESLNTGSSASVQYWASKQTINKTFFGLFNKIETSHEWIDILELKND